MAPLTLVYEDGTRALFGTRAEAIDQAAHDENLQLRKAVEVRDDTPNPETGDLRGSKVAGRTEITARARERRDADRKIAGEGA
jgi:uncharacterized protein (DUF1800 family)